MSRVKSNASAEIAKCDVLVISIETPGLIITASEFLDLIELLIENDQWAILCDCDHFIVDQFDHRVL